MSDKAACLAPCPGSSRVCERTDEHDEHQTTLTPRRTYLYWRDGSNHVQYHCGTVQDITDCPGSP